MEIWKTYIEGFYEVSNLGNVRSVDRVVTFNGTPSVRKGVILRPTKNSKGYMTVVICVNGTRTTKTVHRIVAQVFLDNPNRLPEVNHKDLDTENNSLLNLEWITPDDNKAHAIANGAISRGNVKLTESEVGEIKALLSKGWSNPDIGRMFGVDKATIRNIRIGKNWTHVKACREPNTTGRA